MNCRRLRVNFLALWSLLLLAKLLLAWRLPLFVDEAFYAWEGRQPAWAYADLPGLTAWLTRLGTELLGHSELALRLPFVLLGAVVPWLVGAISARWFGEEAGWRAGLLALLMPLAGLLGVLAVPDVPMVLASLLCLQGIAVCRERVTGRGLAVLAAGLVIGALSHYRFALVLLAGLAGLCGDDRSRRLWRDRRFWWVVGVGVLAWLPLLCWNLEHGGAGVRFQWLERHPWAFHADGAWWLVIQALLLTPLLFCLLVATAWRAWRGCNVAAGEPWRLLAGVAGVHVFGLFLLGFFLDRTRVSFHWPLAGWLALATAAPLLSQSWPRPARIATHAMAAAGTLLCLAWLAVVAIPSWRVVLADGRAYPGGFAGWREAAAAVRAEPGWRETRIVADNFALAAQLEFALRRDDIAVLDHPRNHKHGRATQLQLWRRQFDPRTRPPGEPLLLLVEDSALPMKQRLAAYHARCRLFGALPLPATLNVDHGRKRFLLYRLDPARPARACAAPALAWIDAPAARARVAPGFELRGWAFKDGAGIARIGVTLDGQELTVAEYGLSMPQVASYWKISTDPAQPRVGFRADIGAGAVPPGRHWLGLRIYGRDGAVEDWPAQLLEVATAD